MGSRTFYRTPLELATGVHAARPSRRGAQGVEYRDRLRRLLSKGRIVAVAILFPGQGSQYAGMADPWLAHPAGAAALDEASTALGRDLAVASRDARLL